MAIQPNPYKCIWCLKTEALGANFTSDSHVLPKCAGNEDQQVLPKGFVCDKCNTYFGRDIEPTFIDDPVFKTIMGYLLQRDTKKRFSFKAIQSSEVNREVNIDVGIDENKIMVKTEYIIKGQLLEADEIRDISEDKEYDKRKLAFLSRAILKIAYEALVYMLFVRIETKNKDDISRNIEIFSNRFDAIRKWARYGQPINTSRPFIRFFDINESRPTDELYAFSYNLVAQNNWLSIEMDLFGDCYMEKLIQIFKQHL